MSFSPRSRQQRGIALVLVLGFLVLLSALIISFFSSVQTELQAAKSYASGVTVKQLAETTMNVVMGQITDGTRTFEEPGNSNSTRLTWASQPGLIRTYDENGAIGRTFKLFSAGKMVENEGTDYIPAKDDTLKTEVPPDWPKKSALYTDLNAPVLVADVLGKIEIPGSKEKFTANYPILDPLALLGDGDVRPGVEGFSLDNVPGFNGSWTPSATYNPTVATEPGYTANPAPMPVQWIYILANGSMTSPFSVSEDGLTADWGNLPNTSPNKPSRENPIVGRIAFWTDDETCKLNINTASEGIFWDRPWANSNVGTSPYGETQLRDRLPIKGEVQRYPGHPATTSLSPVLAALRKEFRMPPTDNVSSADYQNYLRRYYDLAPRVGDGGTSGGTVETSRTANPLNPMRLDQNRLYASIDELVFGSPEGVAVATLPAGNATLPRNSTSLPGGNLAINKGNTLIRRGDLERAKFFLTAYNRAPEVNLFAQPRISLWTLQQEQEPNRGKPSDSGSNRPSIVPQSARNARDKLLAFCSTIGSSAPGASNRFPYYFQRYSIYLGDRVNNRGTHTSIPVYQLPRFGYEPPSSQWPALDWNITRNRDLYRYLQRLTDSKIPGWGGKFTDAGKFPGLNRDQILTQMVDLLRSGTNCYAQDVALPPRYEYAPARRMPDAVSGETQIVPLIPPDGAPGAGTKGLGRFATVTEAALIFYATAVNASNQPTKMRCLLMFEPFSPTAASWTWSPLVRYEVEGLQNLSINGKTGVFRPRLVNFVTSRCGYGSGGNHNTAFTGTLASFRRWAGTSADTNKIIPPTGFVFTPAMEESHYTLVSDEIDINPAANPRVFAFGGGDATVKVYSGFDDNTSSNTLVQTLNLRFPAAPAGWPQPLDPGGHRDFNARLASSIDQVIHANDTVRSVEVLGTGPTRGDLRLLSALKFVPQNYLEPYEVAGGGYSSNSVRMVHSLRNGNGALVGGNISASLHDGAGGIPSTTPGAIVAARGTRGARMINGALGDFDNGPYDHPCGAYINKPDDYYGSNSGGGDGYIAEVVTPNRQVPSPVVFGSLPAGIIPSSAKPWQTLLFCANPAAGRAHPGFTQPRDHLLLDFFNMPIVEPYAISEPFSTAGKVNLNYQIAPFTYITRSTALRGVLKSTRVMAIPNGAAYKSGGGTIYRRNINADQTLLGFEERFKASTGSGAYKGDVGAFRSASEICDMYLVPQGATYTQVKNSNWWNSFSYTGDNAREFPYGVIYSRVTTKSNTYTVHMRVQVLRKAASASAADYTVWREGKDQVASEYRGSATIERYIDPNDPLLPDFAADKNSTMDDFYRFRIVSTKKFTP